MAKKVKINFKKGDFITHIKNPALFAIYGGEKTLINDEQGAFNEYSLMCYYNPDHAQTDEDGRVLEVRTVFEYSMDDTDGCGYVITDKNSDCNWWRKCTEEEKVVALKFLAEKKGFAFDEKTNKLRVLGQNERLMFDDDSNVNNRNSRRANSKPKFSVSVDIPDDYKQQEKVMGMNAERMKSLVAATIAKSIDDTKPKTSPMYYQRNYGGYHGGYDPYDEYNNYDPYETIDYMC